jgi:hypothetical protein
LVQGLPPSMKAVYDKKTAEQGGVNGLSGFGEFWLCN